MRNYYLGITIYSVALAFISYLLQAAPALMASAVTAFPLYLIGNKLARNKGLDTDDPEISGADPTIRLKNYGMSALPVFMVVITYFI